jgi:hypothetical protein
MGMGTYLLTMPMIDLSDAEPHRRRQSRAPHCSRGQISIFASLDPAEIGTGEARPEASETTHGATAAAYRPDGGEPQEAEALGLQARGLR